MSKRPLTRVSSIREKPQALERLLKAGISNTADFLVTDVSVLMAATGLSLKDVRELVQEVSQKLCPPFVCAADIYEKEDRAKKHSHSHAHSSDNRTGANGDNQAAATATTATVTHLGAFWAETHLQSGWAALDTALGGGLIIGSLTEVCGPAGCGKTQLCLQVCAHTLLRAHAAATRDALACERLGQGQQQLESAEAVGAMVYIDLDSQRGNAKRLLEMLTYNAPEVLCGAGAGAGAGAAPAAALTADERDTLMSRVIVKSPKTTQELSEELADIQSLLIANKVKLLVIDNVSQLVQRDMGGYGRVREEGAVERYSLSLVAQLKGIAAECKCTVIIANALQDAVPPASVALGLGHSTRSITGASGASGFVLTHKPTLGAAFHHTMCTRLLLCKLPPLSGVFVGAGAGAVASAGASALVVEKSTGAENSVIPYAISTKGLAELVA